MPTLFTPEQLDQVRAIIEKHHAALVLKLIGPDALTPREEDVLSDEKAAEILESIKQSYIYGQAMAQSGKVDPDMDFAEFTKWLKKNPVTLSGAEQSAVQAAQQYAGAHIRHLGAKVQQQMDMMVFAEDAQYRAEAMRIVQDQTALNVQKRESIGALKFELGRRIEDWERDWNRVAITEKVNAMNRGVADQYRAEHGDPWVYKQPMPDACKHCLRLHIGPDGKPRLFRLSTLESHGSNVGVKTANWKAVVGPVHPHCHPEGTSILTPDGEVPIEHMTPGMDVVSHDGTVQKVTSVWSQMATTEMVIVQTEGSTVEATPDHQLFTSDGWVAASLLQNGQDLVRVGLDVEDLVELVAQHEPVSGLEEGRFARVLLLLSGTGMPVTAIDFDGHLFVWKRQVDVEDVDGVVRVRLKPAPDQSIAQRGFVGPVHLSGSTLRVGDEDFVSFTHTPTGLVSGDYVRFEPLGVSSLLSGGDAARFEASLPDAESYGPTADPEGLCYLLHRTQLIEVHPEDGGRVEVDSVLSHERIVSVSSRKFKGRVWNLTVQNTESYVANGIASHNCQCQLIRVPEGWGFDEEGDLVPGGKLGVKYESEADAEKAMKLEDNLQKSFRIKDRLNFQGLPIAIEQRVGDVRRWTDPTGYEGQTRMFFAYGYVEGTLGPDGDEYDVYVGPDPTAPNVYIVHQVDPESGEWDEDKAMVGFPDPHTARDAYLIHYDREEFYGAMSIVPLEEFRAKVLALRRPGGILADGMMKATLAPIGEPTPTGGYQARSAGGLRAEDAAQWSHMGQRAVDRGTSGPQLVIGMDNPFAHLQAAQPRVQVTPQELAGEDVRAEQRTDRQFVVRKPTEVYRRIPGVDIKENVYPYDPARGPAQELGLRQIAQIPENRKFLEEEIGRRVRRTAPNVADPTRQDREYPFELPDDYEERLRERLIVTFNLDPNEIEAAGFQKADRLPGGKGDKLKPEDVDPEQLKMGIEVELEHTNDRQVAREIALDHLAEDPRYYTKLKQVHVEKSVPFVGPRGGLWEDPQHKIPWKAREGVPHIENEKVHSIIDTFMSQVAPGANGLVDVDDLVGLKYLTKMGERRVQVQIGWNKRVAFEGQIDFSKRNNGALITLFVPPGLKTDPAGLAQELRNSLAHEMTHAIDPGIKARLQTGRQKSTSRTAGARDYKQYVNQPAEVAAHMQEVFRDLNDKKSAQDAKVKTRSPVLWAMKNSPRWREIRRELTPENRRRAMKLIAGWFRNHRAGVAQPFQKAGGPYIGPRGGMWADPQHTIPWKRTPVKAKQKKEQEEYGWKTGYPTWIPEPKFDREAWQPSMFGRRGGTEQVHFDAEKGAWNPERKALHDEIIEKALSKAKPPPKDRKPVATISMGGPASGKTSLLEKIGAGAGAVEINSDTVKEQLPEYRQMIDEGYRTAASACQHESHGVMVALQQRALSEMRDVVIDRTGADKDDFVNQALELRDKGYEVRLVMTHVEPQEALERVERRGKETGRFVDPRLVRSIYQRVPSNFAAVAAACDSAVLIDNSDYRGVPIFEKTADGTGILHEEDLADQFDGLQALITLQKSEAEGESWARGLLKLNRITQNIDKTSKPKRFSASQGLLIEVLSDGQNRYVLAEDDQ
jgi:predicted ABC-type ATPase